VEKGEKELELECGREENGEKRVAAFEAEVG
jgi:hypothetical protein